MGRILTILLTVISLQSMNMPAEVSTLLGNVMHAGEEVVSFAGKAADHAVSQDVLVSGFGLDNTHYASIAPTKMSVSLPGLSMARVQPINVAQVNLTR